MSSGISRDEWLKALGDVVKPSDPDALTVGELADMFGIGRQATYLRLKQLVADKRAVQTNKYVETSSGRRLVPAYKLVKGKR